MKIWAYKKIVTEMLDLLDEGIHVIDSHGNTILYNKAMAGLEHMATKDVIGKGFKDVFPDIPSGESTMLEALHHRKSTWDHEQEYLNRDKRKVTTVNSTIPVMEAEHVLGVIEISKDVTGFRQMSHEILDLKGQANKIGAARAKNAPVLNSGKTPLGTAQRKHKAHQRSHYSFEDIGGANVDFLETLFIAKKAAENDHTVLISGETGTGKELFAQSIHYASARKNAPFLAQNCAALPESLLEGILFGTAKGGFTGATDRDGLFVQAAGGTLLLDEISAMPYALQGKLLRVLQERYVRPVGGVADVPTDLRIIATINEPAEALIRTGRLRQDLYYRLNVIRIDVPPLRLRRDDISLLADAFLAKYSRMDGKNLRRLSKPAEEKLQAYDFPGNVRELENMIMAAVSLSGEEDILEAERIALPALTTDSAVPARNFSESALNLPAWLARVEADILMETTARCGGNITRAAADLGIKRQTLQHKLRKISQTP